MMHRDFRVRLVNGNSWDVSISDYNIDASGALTLFQFGDYSIASLPTGQWNSIVRINEEGIEIV